MEDNKTNFEQFLRESADDFFMVPARRVWHSIYNDRHPDRKWPSLAVCFLMLSAILYIGISNNDSIGNAARKTAADNLKTMAARYRADFSTGRADAMASLDAAGPANNRIRNFSPAADPYNQILPDETASVTAATEDIMPDATELLSEPAADTKSSDPVIPSHTGLPQSVQTAAVTLPFVPSVHAVNKNTASIIDDNEIPENEVKNLNPGLAAEKVTSKVAPAVGTEQKEKLDVRAWMEDYAFRNKPLQTGFAKNASLTYYFTPSSGFRTLERAKGYTPAAPGSGTARSSSTQAMQVRDDRSLNLELGAVLNYSVSEKFRIKGGMQINYMNYVTKGSEPGHPTQVNIAVLGASPYLSGSDFSTEEDRTKFNHTSLQLSLPLGADFLIAGKNKLKWYAGGTFQPTYTFGGNALVLSADEKHLVTEKSLRRDLNFNVSAESFLSYRTGGGVTVSAGPQIRYQLLNSFKKPYAYKEHLYNTGVKVAVSRNF